MSPLPVAVALTIVATGAAIVLVRRRAAAFQVPGVQTPGTRSAVVPLGIAAALGVVAAATFVLAARRDGTAATNPRAPQAVAVLDVSGSVSAGGYGTRLANALHAVARRLDTAGFVVFADSAAEVLPPGTPASAVDRLAHFFSVPESGSYGLDATDAARTYASPTPWADAFIGNTDISSGVDLARELLVASRRAPGSRIEVISDLQDGGTTPHLRAALARARAAGIDVRAVPVGSTPSDVAKWRRLGGGVDALSGGDRLAAAPGSPMRHEGDGRPLLLAASAVLFASLLAVGYLWLSPLRLPSIAAGGGRAT